MAADSAAGAAAEARRRSQAVQEIESRAEPGSTIDMARHWSDYRGFLFVGKVFVAHVVIILALLAYIYT